MTDDENGWAPCKVRALEDDINDVHGDNADDGDGDNDSDDDEGDSDGPPIGATRTYSARAGA